MPATGLYFMVYEWLQVVLTPKGAEPGKLSPLSTMLAGGLAGIANWIYAIPPDVLKSRLQAGAYLPILELVTHRGGQVFLDVTRVLVSIAGGLGIGVCVTLDMGYPACLLSK